MSVLFRKYRTSADLISVMIKDFGVFDRVTDFLKDSCFSCIGPSDD